MRKKLGEILVSAGLIDDMTLQTALAEQRRWGGPLGRVLVDMNLISEEVLVVALSKQLNFPTVDLDKVDVATSALETLSGEYAERYGIVPIKVAGKFLDVAMTDPTNLGVLDELRIRTQLNVRPYIAGPKAMERALSRWYGRGVNPLSRPLNSEDVQFPDGMQMLELEGDRERQRTARPEGTPAPLRAGSAAASPRRGTSTGAPPLPRMTTQTGVPQPPQPMLPPAQSSAMPRAEVEALQRRLTTLEQLVHRDEEVLRQLLALLVDKGIASREEILERLK